MKPLPLPDQRHLNAAEGWLGLGDHLAANEELENITPELRAHPAVLSVRYRVYAKGKNWDGAAEIAGTLVKLIPEEPAAWIWWAYSTRRKTGSGLLEAKNILITRPVASGQISDRARRASANATDFGVRAWRGSA